MIRSQYLLLESNRAGGKGINWFFINRWIDLLYWLDNFYTDP